MSLNSSDCNNTNNIISRATTGEVVDRTSNTLKDWSVCISTTETLNKLVTNVASLKVGEDKDVSVSGNLGEWSLEFTNLRDKSCVKLKVAVECKISVLLVSKLCGLLDQLRSLYY